MAQVTRRICDRCRKDVDAKAEGNQTLKRYDIDYHGSPIDLCGFCFNEFKKWLENSDTVVRTREP